jgi:hypothetical protein
MRSICVSLRPRTSAPNAASPARCTREATLPFDPPERAAVMSSAGRGSLWGLTT